MVYAERIVPDETSPGHHAIHEKRYRFALRWCEDKDVVDGACGTGYGSAVLATVARSVAAIDLSPEAIDYARQRYRAKRVDFRVGDLLELDLPPASVDVFCSFETIEHLSDRRRFLAHVRRVLRDDGVFVVSTPRVDQTDEAPANPHHHVEYSRGDFESLLQASFARVELFGQHRLQTRRHRALQQADVLRLRERLRFVRVVGKWLTGTKPMQDITLDDVVITAEDVDVADVLIAVCSEPRR
jgi:SAM-dependent methyltransferase